MNEVPEDIIAAFNSLVESRGGVSKFNDFTLDCALAATMMLRDLRDPSRPAIARTNTAEAASRLLSQLPAPLPPRPIAPARLDWSNISPDPPPTASAPLLADPSD